MVLCYSKGLQLPSMGYSVFNDRISVTTKLSRQGLYFVFGAFILGNILLHSINSVKIKFTFKIDSIQLISTQLLAAILSRNLSLIGLQVFHKL